MMKRIYLRTRFVWTLFLLASLAGALALVAFSQAAADREQLIETGRAAFQELGCNACHSVNGRPGLGPSMLGLLGASRTLQDGSALIADEAYIRESIVMPAAKKVSGFRVAMPFYDSLTPEQVESLVSYLKSLDDAPQPSKTTH